MAIEAKLVPQKWKYTVVARTAHSHSADKEAAFLNSMGSNNWVLCEVRPRGSGSDRLFYYFRKPA